MRYEHFRDCIERELSRHPEGLSWAELKERLSLPYARPCPTWVKQLEQEVGLRRTATTSRVKVWTVKAAEGG